MCIIAVKPKNISIPENILKNMWDNNPHGGGVMWAQDGQLEIRKGLMTFRDYLEVMKQVEKQKAVLHFRWRTRGPIAKRLTHPFFVKSNVGMVHNGTIPKLAVPKGHSDTSIFAHKLYKNLPNPMISLRNSFTREQITSYIGRSKLVFMDGNGDVFIINGHMGVHRNNCWFSNHSFYAPSLAEEMEMIDYDKNRWCHNNKLMIM
jgi:predicted glutamine amidotransferase